MYNKGLTNKREKNVTEAQSYKVLEIAKSYTSRVVNACDANGMKPHLRSRIQCAISRIRYY